jgi:hypothetical protein
MQKLKDYAIGTLKPGKPPLIDRLISSYVKGEEAILSDQDTEILKRWKTVQMLSLQHRPLITNAEIKRVLMKEYGIAELTAQRDIADAQRLFGNVNVVNKEFKRAIYVERLEQLASLAEVKGDFKSAVAAYKQIIDMLRLSEDDEKLMEKGTRIFQLNIVFNGPDGQLSRRTIDLQKINELPATEFKEVMRAIDRPRISAEEMDLMLQAHYAETED